MAEAAAAAVGVAMEVAGGEAVEGAETAAEGREPVATVAAEEAEAAVLAAGVVEVAASEAAGAVEAVGEAESART